MQRIVSYRFNDRAVQQRKLVGILNIINISDFFGEDWVSIDIRMKQRLSNRHIRNQNFSGGFSFGPINGQFLEPKNRN